MSAPVLTHRTLDDQRARAATSAHDGIHRPIEASRNRSSAALSLFTAEGLIRAAVRGEQRGIVDVPSMVHEAYMRWLMLNGIASPIDIDADDSWLLKELIESNFDFHADRQFAAPLLASKHLGDLSTRRKHVGAEIAFVAPVGLFAYRDPEYAFALGVDVARLVHAHPSVYLSAGVLACVIAQLVSASPPIEAIEFALEELRRRANSGPVVAALEACQDSDIRTSVPHQNKRLSEWQFARSLAWVCQHPQDALRRTAQSPTAQRTIGVLLGATGMADVDTLASIDLLPPVRRLGRELLARNPTEQAR